ARPRPGRGGRPGPRRAAGDLAGGRERRDPAAAGRPRPGRARLLRVRPLRHRRRRRLLVHHRQARRDGRQRALHRRPGVRAGPAEARLHPPVLPRGRGRPRLRPAARRRPRRAARDPGRRARGGAGVPFRHPSARGAGDGLPWLLTILPAIVPATAAPRGRAPRHRARPARGPRRPTPVRGGTEAEAATGDAAYLAAMLDAEAALARAQARLGIIPRDAAEAIGAAADPGRFDLADVARRARGSGNPVVPLVEDLRRLAGPAGEHVHRGATSQDIADTGVMLVAARTRRVVLAHLDRALDALAGLAARYRDTPMPARTLGRQALPTTFGAKAANWLMGCLDARGRLAAAPLPVQLGRPAGTLDAFGDRAFDLVAAFAEETGLDRPALPWHTRRTPVAELASALALTAGALGKIATDVWLLSQSEVGEVAE